MQNRVGSQVPTEAQVQAWITTLQTLRTEMGAYGIKLSADDRQRLAKMRSGGEAMVTLIGTLATKYGIALADMPVAGMISDLTLAQRLQPLLSETTLLAEFCRDTIGCGMSEAWQAATGNYSVLRRLTGANPSLQTELKPVKAFFARRHATADTAVDDGTTDDVADTTATATPAATTATTTTK